VNIRSAINMRFFSFLNARGGGEVHARSSTPVGMKVTSTAMGIKVHSSYTKYVSDSSKKQWGPQTPSLSMLLSSPLALRAQYEPHPPLKCKRDHDHG